MARKDFPTARTIQIREQPNGSWTATCGHCNITRNRKTQDVAAAAIFAHMVTKHNVDPMTMPPAKTIRLH